ncbi:hypothetical protein MNB_SV-3-1303 [hydrothermal vent metagenome]|uniref:Uncharacterized protein n=1 Tax=hydrothermal vent metagenome TaxID=652676 RepID=A0A1W1CR97_9ZZZZ
MVLRLEIIITILITMILSSALLFKYHTSLKPATEATKELEFTEATFIEVNTEKMQGHMYGTYGCIDKGVLSLENIVYSTEEIKCFRAKKGISRDNFLYLYQDVFLENINGYTYATTQATYNKKTEMLYITAPFVAKQDKNIIKGKSLIYDIHHKKALGSRINSVVYTTEK